MGVASSLTSFDPFPDNLSLEKSFQFSSKLLGRISFIKTRAYPSVKPVCLQMATPICRKPVASTLSSMSSEFENQRPITSDSQPLLCETWPDTSTWRDPTFNGRRVEKRPNVASSTLGPIEPGLSTSIFPDALSTTTISAHSDAYTWRPFILRRRVLLIYLLLLATLLSTIEALYQSSEAHQGIATSENSKYYFWTYGPTASKLCQILSTSNTNERSVHTFGRILVSDRISCQTNPTVDSSGQPLFSSFSNLIVELLVPFSTNNDRIPSFQE
jgi:hypothetical protein